jgi:hypothetical protein
VNKERALQLAEKAELAAREAEYDKAFDQVRRDVLPGQCGTHVHWMRQRKALGVLAIGRTALICCFWPGNTGRDTAPAFAGGWGLVELGTPRGKRARPLPCGPPCAQVIMQRDAEGLLAQQEAEAARRAAGKMGIKVVEQQMQVRAQPFIRCAAG